MNKPDGGIHTYLISFWPLLLLIGFASALLPSVTVVGYRWTVELALAGFLFLSLLLAAFGNGLHGFGSIPKKEFLWTILPVSLFTIWSGLSVLWASSWRNALHHTLLWACYLTFYVLVREVLRSERFLSHCLKVAGIVVFAISAACIVEYIGIPKPVTSDFTYRYYSYAEAIVALLPLFVAVGIKKASKMPILGFVIVTTAWAMIVVTTSRMMFLAGVVALAIFLVLYLLINRKLEEPRKWFVLTVILIIVTLIPQLPFLTGSSVSLKERFSGQEEYSNLSARSRILLWGMAVEGFRQSPLIGIGGDNYFTDYRQLREGYSARDLENPVLEIDEDLIPERAHNEYLQILSELGLIGGLIFGWLMAGVVYMFYLAIRKRGSLMTTGALSGMAAFLIAFVASSYSFRFPANGLCFFFLLAVAARELFKSDSPETVGETSSASLRWPKWFLVVGIVSSILMIGFSLVRAVSVRHLSNFQNATEPATARSEIEKAIAIDPSEPMFRFYYGQELYLAGRGAEAVPQMRLAIDNGLASSVSYFNLLAVLIRGGRYDEARNIFVEALRVYPRSVFLRTAFASFLKRRGEPAQADVEYQKALEINQKQARSWQLAHDEGLEKLGQTARIDSNYVSTFDLLPNTAPLVLANFQRR
jgi:O-antigen ligase